MDPERPQTTVADGLGDLSSRPRASSRYTLAQKGDRLGRYEVLGVAGQGAMGVVYVAHDPKLDRRVALKLIRIGSEHLAADDKRRARLAREAQALARVSHPNVVPVYDVGEFEEGELFIAMEFIDGSALDEWLEDIHQTESWRAGECTALILKRFVDAGEGLAAAHAAGLIHRDFKPQNVLLSPDGRVYVTDFGLARRLDDGESTLRSADDTTKSGETADPQGQDAVERVGESSDFDEVLTRTGAVLGTPAYMAPEQFRGGSVGPWSDQFSYCVALYRALFGVAPFPGSSRAALAMNVLKGRMRERPREPKIEDRIYAALLKGLATDPADRHADMRTLLGALEPPAQGKRGVAAGLALAGMGLLVASALALRQGDALDQCANQASAASELFAEDRRAELRSGFEGVDPEHGAKHFDGFAARYETYLGSIDAQRQLVCRLPEGPRRLARERCVDRRLSAARAFAVALEDPSATVTGYAMSGVGGLPSVEACADADAASEVPPPDDPETAQSVADLRAQNDTVHANLVLGRSELAMAQSRDLVERARQLAYEPVLAPILATYAGALNRNGQTQGAIGAREEQFELAQLNELPRQAVDAATALVWLYATSDPNHDRAQEWGRHARIAVKRLGDPPVELAQLQTAEAQSELDSHGGTERALELVEGALATLATEGEGASLALAEAHQVKADIQRQRKDDDGALESDLAAIEILRAKWGSGHPRLYSHYLSVGNGLVLAGRLDEAIETLDFAIEGVTATLGPDHPWVGRGLTYRGSAHRNLGNLARAEEDVTRGLAIIQARYGPDTPQSTMQLDFLATIKKQQKKYGDAVELYNRIQAIYTKAYGPDSSSHLSILNNLGLAYKNMGELDLARETFLRALKIGEEIDPGGFNVGAPQNNLGEVELLAGDKRLALRYFESARVIFEAVAGPDHVVVAYPLQGLGETYMAMGKASEAQAVLAQAVELRGEGQASIEERGESHYWLGCALLARGEGEEAREMVVEASKILADAEGEAQDLRTEVQAWLAAHP